MRDAVVILSGVRTAIGDFGGTLKDVPAAELGRIVIAEAVRRAGIALAEVDHVVMGQVIPTRPQDAYLARVAALATGIPVETPALTLNRLCGSGVQAIVSASQMILLGDAAFAVAGGAENMSQAPHHVHAARFGQKMGPVTMHDALTQTLADPIDGFHMGITAENVAARNGIDRAAQDALAAEGHRRAARAITEGRFAEQIVPVEIATRKGMVRFDTDEHVQRDGEAAAWCSWSVRQRRIWRRDRRALCAPGERRAPALPGARGRDAASAAAPRGRRQQDQHRRRALAAAKANSALAPIFPIMIFLMMIVIILQVRSLSAIGIVLATAPLGLIGVVPTLLVTG